VRPPLSPVAHGTLEYLAAPVWILAPALLEFSGVERGLSWILAGGVLGAATLTDYPLGFWRIIPLRAHAWVDRIATPLVIAAPWLGGFDDSVPARSLFVVMGSFGLLVTLLTDFESPRAALSKRSVTVHRT
jgi:hypothetical protein